MANNKHRDDRENEKKDTGEQQLVAKNPNPAANENIQDKLEDQPQTKEDESDQVGSEITDGEDG
jgi:hypothetical protein